VAGKKKHINQGLKLYQKISKEFTKVNESLPENKQLTIQERRKYLKEELYPQFKGTHPYKVGVKRINESISKVYDKVIPSEATDVNLISASTYDDVNWFGLDEYIKEVLPKGIFIRVDAGDVGSTNIFNTKTYNYKKSGVFKITEAIRKQIKNDSDAHFTGVKRLREGKQNNGNPKNYFIDFVLVVGDTPISSLEPVQYKVPKEQSKSVTSVKNAILSRLKDLDLKKKRKSGARKKANKNLTEVKNIAKRQKNAKSENYQKTLALALIKEYNKAIKQLDNALNRGNLTKEQYDKFFAELQQKITNAKRDGGLI
jgi:hypothetical protein